MPKRRPTSTAFLTRRPSRSAAALAPALLLLGSAAASAKPAAPARAYIGTVTMERYAPGISDSGSRSVDGCTSAWSYVLDQGDRFHATVYFTLDRGRTRPGHKAGYLMTSAAFTVQWWWREDRWWRIVCPSGTDENECHRVPARVTQVLRERRPPTSRLTIEYRKKRFVWDGTVSAQPAQAPVQVQVQCTNRPGGIEQVRLSADSSARGELPRSTDAPPKRLRKQQSWRDPTGAHGSVRWDLRARNCPANTRTGRGYAELTAEMKAALERLYARLDEELACYRFESGFRTQEEQDRLRERWHEIADKPRGDTRTDEQICEQLRKRDLGQCPTGYKKPDANGKREALNGPAKVSRHTSGMAADVSVRFPPRDTKDLRRYQAAARAAGLCGPHPRDTSHVELPYVRADRTHPKPTFACHFPEGPAPATATPPPAP